MLINTVILFLSDVLPIVIMMTLLLSKNTGQTIHFRELSYSLLSGFVFIFALINLLDDISLTFDGMGFEVLFLLGYFLIYSFIVIFLLANHLTHNTRLWQVFSLLSLALVLSLNGTNLFIYITGYWTQVDALQSLVIGMVLGAGICLSIGILLYFLIVYCDRHLSRYSSSFLLLLFGAGQINQLTNLLLQIDLLPSSKALWDLNSVIKENSELGQFLHALIGYNATPTVAQIIIYAMAVMLPLVLFYVFSKGKTNLQSSNEIKDKNKNNATQENFL